MDTANLPLDTFTQLKSVLDTAGPRAAAEVLVEILDRDADPQARFYARLLRARVELGVNPFPTGNASDLPAEVHAPYEEAIRTAARDVGRELLAQKDIARAWPYFRLIGEPEPIRQALEAYTPGPDEDPYPIIDIAWQQGVHPERGFELLLERQGICSAITMASSSDFSSAPHVRDAVTKKLVLALHAQLMERLNADLASRHLPVSPRTTAKEILNDHPGLMGEDVYHLDLSHLISVVQLALGLPPGPELDLACDLCEYGSKLAADIRGRGEAPFETPYVDHLIFLKAIQNQNSKDALAHFRPIAEREAAEGNTMPAEMLINLCLRLQNTADALDLAKATLANIPEGETSCPGLMELARKQGDYALVAEVAQTRGDAVTFLASLINQTKG
jgi:hypothetical protein